MLRVGTFVFLFSVTLVQISSKANASTTIDVAFSPEKGATELVIKTIEQAHKSVRVAAYSFTSKAYRACFVKSAKSRYRY